MVPPHSSQIFVYTNNLEKLLQKFCPFCIFILHYLYQCTNQNFLIYHWVSESQFLVNEFISGLP